MAVNKVYKFRQIGDLQNFLNGAIVGGNVAKAQGGGTPANLGPGINGLVGLTLIFTSPGSTTVTFVRCDGAGGSAASPGTNPDPFTLLFKDIKAQIEAAIATVKVLLDADGHIVLVEATPASGVAVSAAGTANSLLGFDTSVATTGKRYQPAVVSNSPPCWTWAYSDNSNMHVCLVWV